MLLEFRVRNYRSFSDEQIFSLVASKDGDLLENTAATAVRSIPRVVRSAVVYGANASGKSNLLRAEIFLSDIKDLAGMNKVWDAWVDPKATPARATIEAKLARPEFKIEIMVIAAV